MCVPVEDNEAPMKDMGETKIKMIWCKISLLWEHQTQHETGFCLLPETHNVHDIIQVSFCI